MWFGKYAIRFEVLDTSFYFSGWLLNDGFKISMLLTP